MATTYMAVTFALQHVACHVLLMQDFFFFLTDVTEMINVRVNLKVA